MEESNSDKQDILAFGEEEQAEQMLQILNSDEIREVIISKYDLIKHYGIDTNDDFPQTRLNKEFKENISFSRTEFLSVRIDVMDRNAQMAADIANDIAALLDSMKTKIQRSRSSEALLIIENAYNDKLNSIALKEDSLRKLRELGVMDFKTQSVILNTSYADVSSSYNIESARLNALEKIKQSDDTSIINTKARMYGAEARLKELKSQLKTLSDYGGASVSLNAGLDLERQDLSKLKEQFDKLRVDVNQNLTHKFIVNKAVKAEKKSYPVRWLIVLVTVACSLILSMVFILVVERFKEMQYKI
jgi:hypothetical protein